MTTVFPMKLADPGFKFEPEWHLFHADRVVDFNDDLPIEERGFEQWTP